MRITMLQFNGLVRNTVRINNKDKGIGWYHNLLYNSYEAVPMLALLPLPLNELIEATNFRNENKRGNNGKV